MNMITDNPDAKEDTDKKSNRYKSDSSASDMCKNLQNTHLMSSNIFSYIQKNHFITFYSIAFTIKRMFRKSVLKNKHQNILTIINRIN